jgi:polypeptide N-acetylgalactosaminyltransferase
MGISDKVVVVRTNKREGLIRAKLIGAQHATGDILVMLDAHSEANYNWLPPLIEPIAIDYRLVEIVSSDVGHYFSTVVCPLIDIIDCESFEYRAQDDGARGIINLI